MAESSFITKVAFACQKKEALFDSSKAKYADRSMYAGAFLTLSTAAGAIAADVINKIVPGSGRLLFPFIFAWGLVYILFLNAELTTSNMMYLTAGTFLKKIKFSKALLILLYCTFFNLVGAAIIGWIFNQTVAYAGLTPDGFVGTVVGTALGGLLPNPEIFGLDFALVGMFIGIFASQFQIMQRRIPVRNLLIILAVVAVSFFLLLTVVSQSLAVLFATLLGCTMGVVLDGQ